MTLLLFLLMTSSLKVETQEEGFSGGRGHQYFYYSNGRGQHTGRNPFEEERTNRRKIYEAYKILGVSQTAKEREIRSAYQKLSLQWHPDKNPNDEKAKARYMDIRQAYDMLKKHKKWN